MYQNWRNQAFGILCKNYFNLLVKFKEHVDNHQQEIATASNCVLLCGKDDGLSVLIEEGRKYQFELYAYNLTI